MSGTGGTLILSLLHKTQPVPIATIIPVVLGEPAVDENDPVLNLLQMYLDRADPVNYARRVFSDPIGQPRHAFHVFGTNDSYAPVETQRTYAQAAGFDIVGPVVDAEDMKAIAEMRKRPAPPSRPSRPSTCPAATTTATSCRPRTPPRAGPSARCWPPSCATASPR
jgi:hypothetical protein